MIDKRTHEVKQDEEKIVYKSLDEIGDELPDNSPRFVLLSYPLTMVRCANLRPHDPAWPVVTQHTLTPTQPSGRLSVPYVMLYYLPITANNELKMLYAGAKELMRNTAEVGKVFDIESAEDLEEIPKKLAAE